MSKDQEREHFSKSYFAKLKLYATEKWWLGTMEPNWSSMPKEFGVLFGYNRLRPPFGEIWLSKDQDIASIGII
jgi:hypothetical protein